MSKRSAYSRCAREDSEGACIGALGGGISGRAIVYKPEHTTHT